MSVDLEKYKNDGWGLSKLAFTEIQKLIYPGIKILEFGSGISTEFFLDHECIITSFDNNLQFAHPMAKVRSLGPDGFYSFHLGDLSGIYDFVLIDGPYDGKTTTKREPAYKAIKEHVRIGTILFIDDHLDYPYVEECKKVYKVSLISEVVNDRRNKWINGGYFITFRIEGFK